MDGNQKQDMIFTGGSDGELKAWQLDYGDISQGSNEKESGEVSHPSYALSVVVEKNPYRFRKSFIP